MIELYVYSTTMSPGNQGVFQLLKEVTSRRILTFFIARLKGDLWYQSRKICAGGIELDVVCAH